MNRGGGYQKESTWVEENTGVRARGIDEGRQKRGEID
jgi:hypothetical protein